MLAHNLSKRSNSQTQHAQTKIKVAFVGGGPSGVAVYLELADQLKSEVSEIVIFDPQGIMGSVAFNSESNSHITNTSVGVTSIKPNCDYDFLSWIRSNYRDRNFKPESFVPRSFVGQYIRDRFDAAKNHLASLGCATRVVNAAVVNVASTSATQHKIQTDIGWHDVFDVVFICPGCSPKHLVGEVSKSPDAIRSPYPESNLLRETVDANRILILGSKLTAIDAALTLMDQARQPSITMVSLSGMLPSVRDALLVHAAQRFRAGAIKTQTKEQLFRAALRAAIQDMKEAKRNRNVGLGPAASGPVEQLTRDIAACELGGNYWQSSMGSFIDEANEIWPLFSVKEQNKLKAKFQGFNSRLISAFPIGNAKLILAGFTSGQLSLVEEDAELCVVNGKTGGFEGRGRLKGRHFDKIINALGVDTRSFSRSHLGRALQTSGWLLNEHGGVLVDPSTMLMCNHQRANQGLYALGAPVYGSILITNYLRSSVIQAQRAVRHVRQAVHAGSFVPKSMIKEPQQ